MRTAGLGDGNPQRVPWVEAGEGSGAESATVADPGFARGADHGERVEHEPKWGSGAERGPWAEPLVGGQEAKPPKAESFM